MKLLQEIGEKALGNFRSLGVVSVFFYKVIRYSLTPRWHFDHILRQLFKIGFLSLPVVGMTAIFTGGALALQIYIGSSRWSITDTVPTIVVLGITRELGPVLTALMVTGRISSAIAAELGTMKVTEQIDALRTLSVDPFRYLIAPRVIASIISLPILTFIFDIIGVFGGYLTSVYSLDFNGATYIIKTLDFMKSEDVTSGLLKSIVFGFIIGSIGCYYGYNSGRGAEGVGKATTNSVVVASILIFIFNYLMTELFFV